MTKRREDFLESFFVAIVAQKAIINLYFAKGKGLDDGVHIRYRGFRKVGRSQASSLPGSATVTVTAENGTTTKIYTISLTITPPTFVQVTGITGVPTAATAGVNLMLSGTVTPANATNKIIVWSVYSPGDAGAATFTTTHFRYYAVGYSKQSFNDVAETA